MPKSQDILLALALKTKGDWCEMYEKISHKDMPTDKEVEELTRDFKDGFVTILDTDYPQTLKETCAPPFVLFYKGNISLLYSRKLLITGTKTPTEEGIAFANELLEGGFPNRTIITHLEKGLSELVIDKCENIICVLNGGFDSTYYTTGYRGKLCEKVLAKGGLLLSSYPLDTEPTSEGFAYKAKIETGIANKTLLLESTKKGLATIILMNTLQQGKDLLVAPVSPMNKNSDNNRYISDGAYPVLDRENLDDLLEQR